MTLISLARLHSKRFDLPLTVLTLARNTNTAGALVNCLLQPGLLHRDTKTPVRNFITAYQTLCTLTYPATETKSIGLSADALVVKVFAAPLRKLFHDVIMPTHLDKLCKNLATPTQTAPPYTTWPLYSILERRPTTIKPINILDYTVSL